ncbi:hypothetical protein J4461_00090 [Candidatus Pacearchaeota archaeon]|nr:hypothetical protein [Candidatus Pacearchaeota archaeon]
MKITSELKNKLLMRKELKAIVESESNPGKVKCISLLAEKFNVSPELIALRNIYSNFGRKTFDIEAFIYDSAEDKNRTEPRPKVVAKKEGA